MMFRVILSVIGIEIKQNFKSFSSKIPQLDPFIAKLFFCYPGVPSFNHISAVCRTHRDEQKKLNTAFSNSQMGGNQVYLKSYPVVPATIFDLE